MLSKPRQHIWFLSIGLILTVPSILLVPSCKTLDKSSIDSTASNLILVTVSRDGSPIEGYKNPRLLPAVGPDKSKASLSYGVEIVFDLSGTSYLLSEIQIKRQASRHVYYNLVLGNKIESRESVVNGVSDNPIPENTQRLEIGGKKIIKIADSPGVTLPQIVADPKSYPISMRAEFVITLQYHGTEIATTKYQIDISRKAITESAVGQLVHK